MPCMHIFNADVRGPTSDWHRPLLLRRLDDEGLVLDGQAWLVRGRAHAGAGNVPAALKAVGHAVDAAATPQVIA